MCGRFFVVDGFFFGFGVWVIGCVVVFFGGGVAGGGSVLLFFFFLGGVAPIVSSWSQHRHKNN